MELPLASDDLNELVHEFCNALIITLDLHAPMISREIVARPKVPWFTNELRKLKMRRRSGLERSMRKSGLESDKQAFRLICQEYSSLLKVSRSAYYSGRVSNCAGDTRKLFQIVKSLCKKSCGNTEVPEYTNPVRLANDFGEIFIMKIDLIMENIDAINVEPPLLDRHCTEVKLSQFSELSENKVRQLIESSSNATFQLDPLPTWLFKLCIDVLASKVTDFVNYSLTKGYVPDQWETALVTPLQCSTTGLSVSLSSFFVY